MLRILPLVGALLLSGCQTSTGGMALTPSDIPNRSIPRQEFMSHEDLMSIFFMTALSFGFVSLAGEIHRSF